jgi:hypothetical protein
MSQQIYLVDAKKGAMYNNRSMLKEFGFKFDPGKKAWYSENPIDDATRSALHAVGISIAGEEPVVQASNPSAFVNAQAEPRGAAEHLLPVNSIVNILAVQEAINFNAGAYLHSRVKNKKPVDAWFLEKCRPGNYFDSMYPGATTVIQQVQTLGMNGEPIKPALWLFVCDANGNVLARLKAAEKPAKED